MIRIYNIFCIIKPASSHENNSMPGIRSIIKQKPLLIPCTYNNWKIGNSAKQVFRYAELIGTSGIFYSLFKESFRNTNLKFLQSYMFSYYHYLFRVDVKKLLLFT